GVAGEVIVVDNGSADGSAEVAASAGARVVRERRRGYGAAYMAGFAAAAGDVIVMADADGSYDFAALPAFLDRIRDGDQFVMGSRFKGHLEPGAMPWTHRHIGSPILSGLLNLLYHTGVDDAHCGMRAFRRDVLDDLRLRMPGMEFASEMVVTSARRRSPSPYVSSRQIARSASFAGCSASSVAWLPARCSSWSASSWTSGSPPRGSPQASDR